MLPVLVYVAAVALPAYALYRFHSQAWYWHVLAIAAALVIGLIPIPPEFQRRGFDLLFGFGLVVLLFWGIGGFIVPQGGHREKHA
ncbi:MAG TPA: hypothetical protein VE959_32285 [Bryobacteraceae bacterium]|nr:hypothetical protein [Bryobacteraceae bacterium]